MSPTLEKGQSRYPVAETPAPVPVHAEPAEPDQSSEPPTYPIPSVVSPKDPVRDPNDPHSPSFGTYE